jgi:hypothetical protein
MNIKIVNKDDDDWGFFIDIENINEYVIILDEIDLNKKKTIIKNKLFLISNVTSSIIIIGLVYLTFYVL